MTEQKKTSKGDKKAAACKHHSGRKSKEHRHCGPIGYYLRTGIKKYACTGT